jgi:ATP-dependent helicase/DNAse subunit B
MQEGEFPLLARPDPFLDDDDRRLLAGTTGLRLPVLEDPLADERHLFYAAVSRPTELLAVSWHAADDDGGSPRNRSPFVDDLADVLRPDIAVRTRVLGQVTWPEGAVPGGGAPARRAAIAAAPPRAPGPPAPLCHPAVLEALARHETFSPTALETLLDCPVKWFVERWLRGRDFEPAPEPMARGTLYHAVLQDVFATLAAPLTNARLAEAQRLLRAAIERHAKEIPVSANANRARASVRRLEVELDALLRHLAVPLEGRFLPTEFELAFGDGADLPAVPVAGDLALKGHIDRVDVDAERGAAVIVDYKGTSGVIAHGDWIEERRIQAALYLHAARHVLEHRMEAALYQPIRGRSLTARGVVRAGVDPGVPFHPDDVLEDEDFDALLADVLVLVRDAVDRIRTGDLTPRPATCGYRGAGCQHPGLCRLEGPAA